jgi:hypothetical protein
MKHSRTSWPPFSPRQRTIFDLARRHLDLHRLGVGGETRRRAARRNRSQRDHSGRAAARCVVGGRYRVKAAPAQHPAAGVLSGAHPDRSNGGRRLGRTSGGSSEPRSTHAGQRLVDRCHRHYTRSRHRDQGPRLRQSGGSSGHPVVTPAGRGRSVVAGAYLQMIGRTDLWLVTSRGGWRGSRTSRPAPQPPPGFSSHDPTAGSDQGLRRWHRRRP